MVNQSNNNIVLRVRFTATVVVVIYIFGRACCMGIV